MTDCPNAEIRDRLPELVSRRLDGESLSAVRAHLTGCASCQAEVELLERARAVLILATPRIDTARIVQSLPAPARVGRGQGFNWRIAAVIAVLVVGGGSTALMYDGWTSPRRPDTLALVTERPAGGSVTDGSELPIASDLSGLTDEQINGLVNKVETIEALPAAETRVPSELSGVVQIQPAGRDTAGGW